MSTSRQGYVVLSRTADGVFSYVIPGDKRPYVAATPEDLSGIATEPLPGDGFMQLDVLYVVSTEYAKREFGLDV